MKLFFLQSFCEERLAELQRHNLLRQRHCITPSTHPFPSSDESTLNVEGRIMLSFCSNDYLGLARHPKLIKAAQQASEQYGIGARASHLICGHYDVHEKLEHELAQFIGVPKALLFSTGYMANIGVITSLVGRNDAVFADKLNHASLNDAVLLSRAAFHRYPHLDLDVLEKLLTQSKAKRKLVVTDAVFSMDGDIAPLPELITLCEHYGAMLLIDDAHGFGVLGPQGRGSLAHFGVSSPQIIYMGTLGKAAGVFGAFVAGEALLIETLMQCARTYIYTTATPPLLASVLLTSLELIREEEWRRQQLKSLIQHLRSSLKLSRWKLNPSLTPIQPLIIGSNQEVLAIGQHLWNQNIWVPVIRPPTVPLGQARLRISLSAAHKEKDIRCLVDAIHSFDKRWSIC